MEGRYRLHAQGKHHTYTQADMVQHWTPCCWLFSYKAFAEEKICTVQRLEELQLGAVLHAIAVTRSNTAGDILFCSLAVARDHLLTHLSSLPLTLIACAL